MLQMKSTSLEREFNFRKDEPRKSHSKSKLEQYFDILDVLADSGPLKLVVIMQQIEFNCAMVIEDLSFLVKQNLVDEMSNNRQSIYSITAQGERVVRFFKKPSLHPRF